MPQAKVAAKVQMAYELKIALLGIHPPIWRRVSVAGSVSFKQLHRVVQFVMGWNNSHLHRFEIGPAFYGPTDPEDPKIKNEAAVILQDVAPQIGDKFHYVYDFGDEWRHEILVEKIESTGKARVPTHCAEGARACPPDDCGGVEGYNELVESMKGPDSERRNELEEWLVGEFDPESFSLREVNKRL